MHSHGLPALIQWLWRASAEPPTRLPDGTLLLVHGDATQLLLRVSLVLGVAIAIAGIALVPIVPFAPVAVPLGLLFIWNARRQMRVAVLLQRTAIGVRDASGRHERVDWDELKELEFKRGTFQWVLRRRDGVSVRFSAFLRGGTEFPAFVRAHVEARRWRRWGTAVDLYRKGLELAKVPPPWMRSRRGVPSAPQDEAAPPGS